MIKRISQPVLNWSKFKQVKIS